MGNITADFITAVKKLHADVRAILTTLHLLREDVKIIREQSTGNGGKTPANQETAGSDALDVGQSHRKQNEDKGNAEPYFRELIKRLKKSARKPRFVLEMLALVGLAAYTCETRRTNNLAEKNIGQSQRNFATDQRPYVWPAEIDPHPLKVGEQVTANVYFVNYGKTPAIKQRMTGKVLLYFGEPTLKQADAFFDSFDESKMVGGGSEIILPPGIPPDLKKSPAFTTSRSDVIPQDSVTLDGIDKTDGSFAIVGIVTYYDSLGTFYRTDYCLMHTANGVLAWCARHNEIH